MDLFFNSIGFGLVTASILALAAVGLGAFSDVPAASAALVHFEEPVTPDDGAMATYEGTYRGYVEARRSLGEVYRSMTGQEGSRRMG